MLLQHARSCLATFISDAAAKVWSSRFSDLFLRIALIFAPFVLSTTPHTHVNKQTRGVQFGLESLAPCCLPGLLANSRGAFRRTPSRFIVSKFVPIFASSRY